jgi:hypothetical protein
MPYAWSMRTIHAAACLAAALALVSGTAAAQHGGPAQHGQAQQGEKQQPLILEKQQLGTAAFASVARARMRGGDCAGALDAFDAAIAHSIDASIRRDRGLCHEQLDHPYPAIDDYRAYLTAEPDAPDAEGIRGRLARLEQNTSGKSSQGDDTSVPSSSGTSSTGGGAVAGSASVTVSGTAEASGDGAQASTSSSSPRDPMDYVARDSDVMRSPLRTGKGFSFAPYFSEHKWFNSGSSFGDSDTWAECVGLQLRYSFSHLTTLFIEGAYQHFNSTSASTDSVVGSIQGMTSQIGLELRFPLDPQYDNQLIVAPGLGFDHIVVSTTLASSSANSEGAIIPRARFGWRHMVDSSASIDLSLDAGVGKFAQYDGDFPFGGNGQEVAMLGLNLALVWGL